MLKDIKFSFHFRRHKPGPINLWTIAKCHHRITKINQQQHEPEQQRTIQDEIANKTVYITAIRWDPHIVPITINDEFISKGRRMDSGGVVVIILLPRNTKGSPSLSRLERGEGAEQL